jgi:xanthine dehydrogenase accessory factor
MTFWNALVDELESGATLFVAAVGDHTRHSPGTRGAKMFVRADSTQHGTIGGGAMEADILERAHSFHAGEGFETDATETLHHRADADGKRSGLICAGKQTMAYWVAKPEHAAAYRAFVEARDAEPVELAVSHGVPELRDAPIGANAPIRLDDATYCEHAVNHRRAAIAGGGHCGLALSRALSQLGYAVTVFDIRPDLFTLEQNRGADRIVVVDDYADIGPHIRFPALTHAVVMTANLPSDVRALIGLHGLELPFLGVMGSSAKLAKIRAEVEAAGAQSVLDGWFAPVGLSMTSNTPEEIAVSIAAQFLQLRESLFEWERPSPLG